MRNWYNIFNLDAFVATGLVSRTYNVSLEDIGVVDVEVYRANEVSIQYDGEFMPISFAGKNPYVRGEYAVYKDGGNNIWLGFEA